jgi:hypothetical protein
MGCVCKELANWRPVTHTDSHLHLSVVHGHLPRAAAGGCVCVGVCVCVCVCVWVCARARARARRGSAAGLRATARACTHPTTHSAAQVPLAAPSHSASAVAHSPTIATPRSSSPAQRSAHTRTRTRARAHARTHPQVHGEALVGVEDGLLQLRGDVQDVHGLRHVLLCVCCWRQQQEGRVCTGVLVAPCPPRSTCYHAPRAQKTSRPRSRMRTCRGVDGAGAAAAAAGCAAVRLACARASAHARAGDTAPSLLTPRRMLPSTRRMRPAALPRPIAAWRAPSFWRGG